MKKLRSVKLSKEQEKMILQKALQTEEGKKRVSQAAMDRAEQVASRVWDTLLDNVDTALRGSIAGVTSSGSKTIRGLHSVSSVDARGRRQERTLSFQTGHWAAISTKTRKRSVSFWYETDKLYQGASAALLRAGKRVTVEKVNARISGSKAKVTVVIIPPRVAKPFDQLLRTPFLTGQEDNGYRFPVGLFPAYGERPDWAAKMVWNEMGGPGGKIRNARLAAYQRRQERLTGGEVSGPRKPGHPPVARPFMRLLAARMRSDMIRVLSGR